MFFLTALMLNDFALYSQISHSSACHVTISEINPAATSNVAIAAIPRCRQPTTHATPPRAVSEQCYNIPICLNRDIRRAIYSLILRISPFYTIKISNKPNICQPLFDPVNSAQMQAHNHSIADFLSFFTIFTSQNSSIFTYFSNTFSNSPRFGAS